MVLKNTYDNLNFIYKYNLKYPDEPETLEAAILLMKDLDFEDNIDDMDSLRYVSHLLRDNNVIPTHIERAIQLYPNPLNKENVKALVALQLKEAESYLKEIGNYKHTDEVHYSERDRDKIKNMDTASNEMDKIRETLEKGRQETDKNITDKGIVIKDLDIEGIVERPSKFPVQIPVAKVTKMPADKVTAQPAKTPAEIKDFQEGKKTMSYGPRTIREKTVDKSLEIKEPEIEVTKVYRDKLNGIIEGLARTRIRNNLAAKSKK